MLLTIWKSDQPAWKCQPLAIFNRRTGQPLPLGMIKRQSKGRSAPWRATNLGGMRYKYKDQCINPYQYMRLQQWKTESEKLYQLIQAVVFGELLNEWRECEVIHGPVVFREWMERESMVKFGWVYLVWRRLFNTPQSHYWLLFRKDLISHITGPRLPSSSWGQRR